jgi:hypothetical protein
MSQIVLSPDASGTGQFTIASPNSNTNRTVNLPDAAGTMVLDTATQTLTNKTLTSPTITGGSTSNTTIQGGALTLATAQNSTSGTNIDFTGIPSWVKRITVMFSGISGATNSWQLTCAIGDSGGIESTGYIGTAGRGTSSSWATATSSTSYVELQGAVVGVADTIRGSLIIQNLSGNTWIFNGVLSGSNTTTHVSTAEKTLSDVLTQVRISIAGATAFDAGTINIMYEG